MIQARIEKTTRNKALALGLLLTALLTAMVLTAKSAHADTTFTVNSTADSPDASTADNKCDVDLTEAEEQCTLRAAIQQANVTSGKDTIEFNIPGNGPHTISPSTALSPITDEVIIDGYSQGSATSDPADDAKPNTLAVGNDAVIKIELDGTGTGPSEVGLRITTSNSTVKGLAIGGFGRGIVIEELVSGRGGDGNEIEGNFVGTDASGTTPRGNVFTSLSVGLRTSNNVIGGTLPKERNLISGSSVGFTIGVVVGGDGNKVEGNYIGTAKDGISPLPNGSAGVMIDRGSNTTIGGTASGAANTIAFNGADGVVVLGEGSTSNRILGNSIFSNGEEGIDLNQDGVTANDPRDPDNGPNNLQNFPVLSSATASDSSTTVTGTLKGAPNQTFTVQLFSSPEKDPSGFGEGQTFLGEKNVTTGANGNASFSFSAPVGVPIGQFVTATATSASGDTSEFSKAEQVQPPPKGKKRR